MKLDVDHWKRVLTDCGVGARLVPVWAPVFEARVRPEAFKRGARTIPYFIGQLMQESGRLSVVEENLNYTARRLTEVWPRRFPTIAAAAPYAGKPEALANLVYGSRLGNSKPGDGYRYRGRGPIQITGRSNYAQMEAALGERLLDEPDRLLEQDMGLRCAVAWWAANAPDSEDVRTLTLAVNGGEHGLVERRAFTDKAIVALG